MSVRSFDWHFHPDTGTPFWLERAEVSSPSTRSRTSTALPTSRSSACSRTNGCAAAPCAAGCPRRLPDKPIYVFETGGTTGIPKSRVVVDDFRIDYELFSDTLPDKYFPKGANWLMLGPSGPRRLRLAVEHLCQHRGGICFCVDLDPRWVVKLIKKGWMEHLKAYQEHFIDQAMTILSAGHDIKCMFTTPKLLDALAGRLEKEGSSIAKDGHHRHLLRRHRDHPAVDPLRHRGIARPGIYITPTYGNTLMGLAAADMPVTADEGYKITYYAPQPRAVIEVVDFDDHDKVVDYGQTGACMLTTLTKEFFVPRFLERDEGEREKPLARNILGRRQRRPAVPRVCGDDDGWGILSSEW